MSEPSQLLFELAAHDSRIYCAFNITKNEYVYANEAFLVFFDLKPEEITPRFLFGKVHPEDQNYLRSVFESMKPGNFRELVEFRFKIHEKQYFLRLSMLLTDCDDGGVVTGYIDDITSFKESLSTLEALSNKKNAVLNILSHDLAGPLGSIANYSFLLSKKADPADQLTLKMISSIESISKRCIKLIQEFIKLEFMESAGVDLVKARRDLVKTIGDFMIDYGEHQQELKKTIRFNHKEDQVFAEIDDNKLMQVINNLISNALKFTPDDGEIEVNLYKIDQTVRIEVRDSGIGIPKEFHAHLFDKFNKARRTGIKGEASVGLGMSIIKTIVDWHKGRIWLESEEGKGTTFYIEIPGCD